MFELRSRVRYSEVDETGQLKLTSLMNYMQDCCTMQAEDLGIGLSYLQAHHIGWMVTSYQVKLLRALPKMGQEIVVKTWPYQFRGMLGYRNFTVETAQGELLAEADSLWILMDLQEGKPIRLPQEMMDAYEVYPKLSGAWDIRKKLSVEAAENCGTFEVSPWQMDTNHHMNNAKYIEVAESVLEQNGEKQIAEIFIAFKKAAQLGDEVSVYRRQQEARTEVALCNLKKEEYCIVEFTFNKQGR